MAPESFEALMEGSMDKIKKQMRKVEKLAAKVHAAFLTYSAVSSEWLSGLYEFHLRLDKDAELPDSLRTLYTKQQDSEDTVNRLQKLLYREAAKIGMERKYSYPRRCIAFPVF